MKLLVSPFFCYLLLQLAGLWLLQRRAAAGRSRVLLRILTGSTLLLAIVSTPVLRGVLQTSLTVMPASSDAPPAFIFVLGGGYLFGEIPEEDALSAESERRVLHGVVVWKRYPSAHLVFSGAASGHGVRDVDRLVRLMARRAQDMGVPASAVLLEPRSANTREHPVEALALPGVTPTQPIAIVTSGWHMRRARREFCRYFEQVQIYPLSADQPLKWWDFIPDADTLDASTFLIREWVGSLWYELTRPSGQHTKC